MGCAAVSASGMARHNSDWGCGIEDPDEDVIYNDGRERSAVCGIGIGMWIRIWIWIWKDMIDTQSKTALEASEMFILAIKKLG